MDGILDRFVQPIGENEPFFCRGALAWAPSAFLTEQFWEVKFANTNPAADFGKGWISLQERTAEDCHDPKTRIFNHNPIHPLHLRANEAYAALRHKLRLVVIVSVGTDYGGLGERALRQVQRRFPECYVCAPIYTLRSEAEPEKYQASFIEKVKAYGIPMTFYLRPELGLRESCVRFDRMQAIAGSFLRPHKIRLADECQRVFDDWLHQYIFGQLPADSFIPEYKQMLADGGVK
jgi:hypothetical protein